MRSYRVLSFAVLLCIICSIICGRTYASDIWTIDGNVDPWGDLEAIENWQKEQEEQQAAADLEPAAPDDEQVLDFGSFGGISLFSLNDEDNTRSFSWSGSFAFGAFSRSGSASNSYLFQASSTSGSVTSSYTNNSTQILENVAQSKSYYGSYVAVAMGSYVDVTAGVNYSSNDYSNIVLSGGGTAYITGGTAASAVIVYPTSYQLLVNGSLYGDVIPFDNTTGSFTIPNISIDLTSGSESIT